MWTWRVEPNDFPRKDDVDVVLATPVTTNNFYDADVGPYGNFTNTTSSINSTLSKDQFSSPVGDESQSSLPSATVILPREDVRFLPTCKILILHSRTYLIQHRRTS